MQKIKVLVTCVGGMFAFPILNALKKSLLFNINLLGVDASFYAAGRYICDDFFKVPHAGQNPDAYWDRLQELIKLEKPDLILPLSESETLIFSNFYKEILSCGAKLSFGSADTVKLMLDKYALLNFLQKAGIKVGHFARVSDLRDLDHITSLGFPEQKVVLKPRIGTGSRGVVILDDKVKKYETLLEGRMCGTGNFEAVKALFLSEGFGSGYLAMPFVGPDTFDVDCLFTKGKSDVIIPRLREYQNPLSPVNEGCVVEDIRDNPIVSYIQRIGEVLSADGVCDFDVARNPDGEIRLLDASCRLSGSVGASMVAGFPVVDLMLANRFGLKPPEYPIISSARIRPFSAFFKTQDY